MNLATQTQSKFSPAAQICRSVHLGGCFDLSLLFMKASQVQTWTESNMLIKHHLDDEKAESTAFALIHL